MELENLVKYHYHTLKVTPHIINLTNPIRIFSPRKIAVFKFIVIVRNFAKMCV